MEYWILQGFFWNVFEREIIQFDYSSYKIIIFILWILLVFEFSTIGFYEFDFPLMYIWKTMKPAITFWFFKEDATVTSSFHMNQFYVSLCKGYVIILRNYLIKLWCDDVIMMKLNNLEYAYIWNYFPTYHKRWMCNKRKSVPIGI